MILASLEMLDCDREQTSILTLVDGDASLFLTARNLTEQSKFASRLCIQRKPDGRPRYDLRARRLRISSLHNEMKRHIPADCDYVFSLEDDGVIKPDALKRLLNVYLTHPFAGLVTGVQIGRHGIHHLGLWAADDVYEPTTITSLVPGEGVQEIDAAGMYCVLTKRGNYINHEFKPFGNNDLGPDVEWGLALRQVGFKNYAEFGVWVEHRLPDGGVLTRANTTVQQMKLTKDGGMWRQQVIQLQVE